MAEKEKIQVTIIGLGLIGTSAGLALRRHSERVHVVGHDARQGYANEAKSRGALDQTEWNLPRSVARADRVLLALPSGEIKETLECIATELKPGCVLLDTASVKAPVLAWSRELLPDSVHLVGGHPFVLAEDNTAQAARADLFEGCLFGLVAEPGQGGNALQLAADLVEALGAKPYFMDAAEHDGLCAAVEQLPMLLAGVLASVTAGAASWKDMRRTAGGQYYSTAMVLPDTAAAAAADCLSNRDNLLRWIDNLSSELDTWREMVEAGDAEGLTGGFERGMSAWRSWLVTREKGNWDEHPVNVELPGTGHYMRGLLGLGWKRDRLDKDKKKKG